MVFPSDKNLKTLAERTKEMIEVRTSYAFDGSFYRDDAAYQAAGRPSDFSGYGLGTRDLGWICKSEIEAERIKRALNKIGLTVQ